jgi:hypothetical protein
MLAAALALAATPAAAAAPASRFFQTHGGAIECQLNDGGGLGVEAYCQTGSPPRSVTMNAAGKLDRCSGPDCIGNPPLDVATLADGSAISFGPFKCTNGRGAIACKIKDGRGFTISRAGVKRS